MKKYYQINTVSKSVKPITLGQAAKKIVNRDFIAWYEDDEIVFIADCTEDERDIRDIILSKFLNHSSVETTLKYIGLDGKSETNYFQEFDDFFHRPEEITLRYIGAI